MWDVDVERFEKYSSLEVMTAVETLRLTFIMDSSLLIKFQKLYKVWITLCKCIAGEGQIRDVRKVHHQIKALRKVKHLRPILDIIIPYLTFPFQNKFLYKTGWTESTFPVVCFPTPHALILSFRHTGSHWLFSGSACFWILLHIVYPHANTLNDIP